MTMSWIFSSDKHGGGIGHQMGYYFLRAYQASQQRLRYRGVDSRGPWSIGLFTAVYCQRRYLFWLRCLYCFGRVCRAQEDRGNQSILMSRTGLKLTDQPWHVHRSAPFGICVLITGTWYKSPFAESYQRAVVILASLDMSTVMVRMVGI